MHIPVLSRLSLGDYHRMIMTFLILLTEEFIRYFLMVWSFFSLPFNTTTIFKYSTVFHRFLPKFWLNRWKETTSPDYQSNTVHPISILQHVVDMAAYWGLSCEEYAVETKDGYWLGVHRLVSNSSETSPSSKPAVLLWHGFMMNSEVWLAHPEGVNGNLALYLIEAGYDVWLGNVRGNKYSHKHSQYKPQDTQFWDFSLDEHALIDLPTVVDFILEQTGQASLTYIGFSQGTTICFASLSLVPTLRSKINLFIGLAPSTAPFGLTNPYIATFARTSAELSYLIFGRKSLLPSVYFYQSMLSPALFSSVIDTSVNVLFHWKSQNMSLRTKSVAYQHLYSLCSVKVMVHWFQIIKACRFQMYDDVGTLTPRTEEKEPRVVSPNYDGDDKPVNTVLTREPSAKLLVGLTPETLKVRGRKISTTVPITLRSPVISQTPIRYPTEQLSYTANKPKPKDVPIALFYGGSDSLLDMHAILKGLRFAWDKIALKINGYSKSNGSKEEGKTGLVLYDIDKEKKDQYSTSSNSPLVYLKCVPPYEHLCFLWADTLRSEVFPDVERLLEKYSSNKN